MAYVDLLILWLIMIYFAAQPQSSKAQRISLYFSAALTGPPVLKT